ncbi:MAG: diguanylate cyclase [Candidatus Fraserbacteria bacterium RBG_16_55_9]|uniref:Diguanylate cyclase n=1 Tax=Fraserbacteria sp. (strain RBG_16_55_9) TaxID=1817864 RepID=A0A1F5V2Z9_FRAXR|nr:MAG: diguanylate cyclase [Candidatus Fraserbacteria bacterium RBG_16_55_9]
MFAYLVRRALQIIPTLFVISVVIYALLALKPGDPIDELRRGNPGFTAADYDRLIKLYGLDKPWYVRYWYWVGRAAQGDFGPSRRFGMPAAQYVFQYRLPNTLLLSGLSLLIAFVIAVPTGMLSALRQHSLFDYGVTFVNFIGVSIPIFWFGIMLMYIFSVQLRLLPAGSLQTPGIEGLWPIIVDRARHLILPVAALSSLQMASWTRFMRSSMLEIINLDYIRTARAKGLPERLVTVRHTMRNAILPIITLVALAIPTVMSGAVLTETVFNWPGMGRAIFDAIVVNDFNVAMVSLMFISLLVLLFNLLADIIYVIVDPRIRYD